MNLIIFSKEKLLINMCIIIFSKRSLYFILVGSIILGKLSFTFILLSLVMLLRRHIYFMGFKIATCMWLDIPLFSSLFGVVFTCMQEKLLFVLL